MTDASTGQDPFAPSLTRRRTTCVGNVEVRWTSPGQARNRGR
ncbi:MAG TPA: hypothetical protein VHY34_08275 [Caulobacteraceae bacterium]|jgi:hypothetical protein|nr:hypothetical protein [Caulobacteraceae bacterium]